MKNLKNYLFALLAIAFFSSCSDVENEIWINEDGSGKLEVKYDMSSMLEMASMFEGMGDEMDESSEEHEGHEEGDGHDHKSDGDKIEKKLNDIKSFDDVMDQLSNPNSMVDIDTTFNMYSVMPDSIKNTMKNAESFKKINMSVKSNKAESIANFALSFEYDSHNELTEMFESFAELDKDTDTVEKKKSMDKLRGMITSYEADLKNGTITIPEQDFAEGIMDNGLTGGKSLDDIEIDGEEMSMIQMLFGDASIVTKMHLPGEVISCDDPTADIFGNQIRFKDSFIDLMKNKKTKGRVIKFKK